MKQIIIFLLLIILGIMGFNLYSKYKRFSLKNYSYKSLENINITKENKPILLDYHRAIQDVNGYIITQWSAHNIDVGHPKKDNGIIKAAVAQYRDKLANVKYYESLLKNTKQPKVDKTDAKRKRLLKVLLSDTQALRIGQSNAAVYELQKLLVKKGFDIPVDGFYKDITMNAIKAFEEKEKLFPDGKMDILTLNALLN